MESHLEPMGMEATHCPVTSSWLSLLKMVVLKVTRPLVRLDTLTSHTTLRPTCSSRHRSARPEQDICRLAINALMRCHSPTLMHVLMQILPRPVINPLKYLVLPHMAIQQV